MCAIIRINRKYINRYLICTCNRLIERRKFILMKYPDKESLEARYEQYSDEQLIHILKNRKDYQENAVRVTIEVAIKRNLIHSEQDLLSLEFNIKQKSTLNLFPKINSETQKQRVLRSLSRILYFSTLIPLIQTYLFYKSEEISNTVMFAAASLIWIGATYLISRGRSAVIGFLMLILLWGGVVYASRTEFRWFTRIDWTIYSISILLITYLILFAQSIIKSKK